MPADLDALVTQRSQLAQHVLAYLGYVEGVLEGHKASDASAVRRAASALRQRIQRRECALDELRLLVYVRQQELLAAFENPDQLRGFLEDVGCRSVALAPASRLAGAIVRALIGQPGVSPSLAPWLWERLTAANTAPLVYIDSEPGPNPLRRAMDAFADATGARLFGQPEPAPVETEGLNRSSNDSHVMTVRQPRALRWSMVAVLFAAGLAYWLLLALPGTEGVLPPPQSDRGSGSGEESAGSKPRTQNSLVQLAGRERAVEQTDRPAPPADAAGSQTNSPSEQDSVQPPVSAEPIPPNPTNPGAPSSAPLSRAEIADVVETNLPGGPLPRKIDSSEIAESYKRVEEELSKHGEKLEELCRAPARRRSEMLPSPAFRAALRDHRHWNAHVKLDDANAFNHRHDALETYYDTLRCVAGLGGPQGSFCSGTGPKFIDARVKLACDDPEPILELGQSASKELQQLVREPN